MTRLADIAALRLRNQRLVLSGAHFKKPEDVVGFFGAVQSQEYALARWSVGMRLAVASDSAVESAIALGRIVRTHILRPTWHFVLPRDLHWMQRLTAPRWEQVVRRRTSDLGLTPRDVEKAFDLMRLALAGGSHMSRAELGRAITAGGVSVAGPLLAFVVMAAETSLVVASGSGQNYALVPEVAAAHFDRDAALAELALRYFTSHGPATVGDFTWWSSLTVSDARRGIAANPALSQLTVADTDYYWAGDTASRADAPDDPRPTAHLLQGFDEYIVGYRSPRTYMTLAGHGPHTALNTPSWLNAVVIDGQLAAWWRRAAGTVQTKPLRDFTRAEQRAVDAAIARYLAYLAS